MTIRFLLILFSLHLLAAVTPSHAEEIRKAGVRTVGILMLTASEQDAIVKALREGLRELGYVEGRNIHVEFRTAQGNVDQLPALATQLAQAGAEVIVLTNMLTAQAVQRTAPTVPIVVALFDPLASGLVTNLAHP